MIEAGARGAWRELEGQLRPFVARRVPPADVDDVVQDVFLRLYRGLATLRDDQRFGGWVYQVARNAITDHHRRAARDARWTEIGDVENAAAIAEDDDAVAQEVAVHATLFVALLPSPYREALTLTELEGCTQKDAAEMLGISVSGMKSRVQRGRRLLREALDACCRIALDGRGRVVACEPRRVSNTTDCC